VVSFFLSPFIVHHLGNAQYGTWTLLTSVVGYMALLDLGIRGAVTRYIARFHAADNHHESSKVVSSALLILTIAAISAVSVSVLLAFNAIPSFKIPLTLITTAQIVVVLGGITIGISLITGAIEGTIIGLQRFDYGSYLDVIFELSRAVAVIVVLQANKGLIALASVQLSIAAVRGLSAYLISRRLYPELHILRVRWDKHSLRLISSFSIFAVALMAASRINTFTDPLVIGTFLPIELATFFAIASSLTTYGRSIVTGITFTLIPLVSAIEARGQSRTELQTTVLHAGRFASLAILPVIITFIVRGRTFIGLWMGHQYIDLSGHVLWILSIALWADAGLLTVHAAMLGLNRHKGLVPLYLIEAAANLGLSIYLVQHIGIVGVAWGTTIPRLVNALACGPLYLRHILQLSPFRFLSQCYLKPALSMVPFAIVSLAVEDMWPAHNLIYYFAQIGATLPLAVLGTWMLGLTAAERKLGCSWIYQKLGRSAAGSTSKPS
jgi:O-antigen/teichoic acid export membrane protein